MSGHAGASPTEERPAKRRNKVFGIDYELREGALSASHRAVQQARWNEYTRFNPGPHYRLLARKFDWDFATDEQGYHWFGDCQEVHDEFVEYFAAFGLSYEDYATIPAEKLSDIFDVLYWRAVFYVLDYVENPAHFEEVTAYLPVHCRNWLKSVAVGNADTAKAKKALASAVKANPPKGEVLPTNHGSHCREFGFERYDFRRCWFASSYKFMPFEINEHGRYYIADPREHASFCGHASAFGYEYRDIATDKKLLDVIAEVLIGSVGQGLYQRLIGRTWSKSDAEALFAGCSPKVVRYVSAVHGRRLDTVWKLRDEVFPELQSWAKKHPPKRGKLTAYGRMD